MLVNHLAKEVNVTNTHNRVCGSNIEIYSLIFVDSDTEDVFMMGIHHHISGCILAFKTDCYRNGCGSVYIYEHESVEYLCFLGSFSKPEPKYKQQP